MILAIMIIPIISSITREVLIGGAAASAGSGAGAGRDALGDDPAGRAAQCAGGNCGRGSSWGSGRALGETMAVTMVIGNRPEIAKSLFAPGYTMASVLANEFSEATGDLNLSALIEIGLALFLVTIVVNALARLLVWSVTRGQRAVEERAECG